MWSSPVHVGSTCYVHTEGYHMDPTWTRRDGPCEVHVTENRMDPTWTFNGPHMDP